jgi:hypothetical protein
MGLGAMLSRILRGKEYPGKTPRKHAGSNTALDFGSIQSGVAALPNRLSTVTFFPLSALSE